MNNVYVSAVSAFRLKEVKVTSSIVYIITSDVLLPYIAVNDAVSSCIYRWFVLCYS